MTQQLEDPNPLALLGRSHVVAIEDALGTGSTQPPFPPIDDREAWERIRLVLSDDEVSQVLRQAEAAAREPIPPLPAGLYLEFLRNGDRAGYEQPTHWRREALWSLALAECL